MTCTSASREAGHYQILLSGDSEELFLLMRLLLFTNAAGLSARHLVLLARNPAYRNLPGGRKGAGQLIGIRPAVGKLVSMFAYSKTKYGRQFLAV